MERSRSRGDLIEANKIITKKEALLWERFFELTPNKAPREHRYKSFRKPKGTVEQKYFSAKVVDLWSELDDSRLRSPWAYLGGYGFKSGK